MARTLDNVARAVGGQLVGADRAFTTVSTDTRSLTEGALFVALKGPNFDGHRFLEEAAGKGAAGAVVEEPAELALNQVTVADSRRALGGMAAAWRDGFEGETVAITGSNGKTTTKELIASILSGMGPVHATRGNFNNDIGLPLTVLDLTTAHRMLVLEMGANHPGEIAYLTAIAKPTVGLVTNAGPAHLEGFGTLDGVANAKGELFAHLPADGTAIINGDDAFAPLWRTLAEDRRVVEFGRSPGVDCRLTDEMGADANGQRFRLVIKDVGTADIELPLQGQHNALNAAGAAAAAIAAGASLAQVVAGLNSCSRVGGRLASQPGRCGALIIDDSYNANPASVAAAIDTLAAFPGRRVLVLGDMGELGDAAESLHERVGRYAAERGLDELVCIGELSANASDGFGGGRKFANQADALDYLEPQLNGELVLLVKGSRAMGLEKLVAALTDGVEAARC